MEIIYFLAYHHNFLNDDFEYAVLQKFVDFQYQNGTACIDRGEIRMALSIKVKL